MRRNSSETKRKILTACVRLFLEEGYKSTSVSRIVEEAGVARGSYLNLFPTKDKILLDLTESMFGGQFDVARSIADKKLPPVYAYAVETSLQLTLTELNENLREIYISPITAKATFMKWKSARQDLCVTIWLANVIFISRWSASSAAF